MFASRRFMLTLALAAISILRAPAIGGQTIAPVRSTTAPSTDTSAVIVTQQATSADAEARIRALEDRIATLEKSEAQLTTAAAAAPVVTASRDGLAVRSPDNAFSFRLRGYVQSDARFFGANGPVAPGPSTFLLRRVRPILEATAYKYFGLRLMPDFGNGQVVLYDAYAEAKPSAALNLRVGKFKPPIGLERLQSATDVRFVERGLPTNLVPNRDVGLQIFGDLAGGHLSYAVGVFNGVADLGNGDGDVTNDKDFEGRLFARVGGLGLGIAAGTGTEHGTVAASVLPSYVSPGQQTLFRYRDSSVADGRRVRVAPQAYWYVGPVGVLGEYVISGQDVTRTTSSIRITNRAWQVAVSWFVTGEKASFTTVAPRRPFDPKTKSWGALEIGARYGELHPDEDAFPTFAVVTNSVRSAKAWGAGITWHLAPGVRVAANYERTTFTAGATTGDRVPETFVVARIQQSF